MINLAPRAFAPALAPVWLGLLAAVSALRADVTPMQTVSFAATQESTSADVGSGMVSLSANQPLIGFTKFNPSLGTLTEIRFYVQVDARYELTVTAAGVADEGSPFSVVRPASPGDLVQAGVVYSPTAANFGLAVTFDNATAASVGGENLSPQDHGAPGNFLYQDSRIEEFGGFAQGGGTPTEGSLLASNPDINLADFVGSGAVPGLNFSLVSIITNGETPVNVPQATLGHLIAFAAGSATLQYVYTPAVTSTPVAITRYRTAGATHTLDFTGPAGRTDWTFRGTDALPNFNDDHTSSAAVTEPNPGVYRAVLHLPALTAPRYFFRVEPQPILLSAQP